MELIGLDVGFSATRASSGVARWSPAGGLVLGHTTSRWGDRRALTGSDPVRVAAIDAPHTTAPTHEPRDCERILGFGAFQRRCKPGLSHVRGTGRSLRAAGRATATQLRSLAPSAEVGSRFPRVADCNVVEAFPNAFLGVCLAAPVFEAMPRLRRGRKFDWLYESWIARGLFRPTISQLGIRPAEALAAACATHRHHDERAALVCLLTAAGVWSGRYTAVGEPRGGYLFLPSWSRWAPWAREELDRQRRRLPQLQVWIDGSRYAVADPLPVQPRPLRARP